MKMEMARETEHRLIVICSGQMGWDSQEELVRRLGQALEGRARPDVLVDLEGVDLITSAGLGSLLQVRKMVSEQGGRLVFTGASPLVAELFRTVGLDRHILMTDTLENGRTLLAQAGVAAE